MNAIQWEFVPPVSTEKAALQRIMVRADALAAAIDWPGYSRLAMMMDIEFVHQDIVKLDLIGLANAPAADFNHDVLGIWNHYNRVTGEMENCFMPRCAKQDA